MVICVANNDFKVKLILNINKNGGKSHKTKRSHDAFVKEGVKSTQ